MTASEPAALSHSEARERWGLPDAVEGSVNDPRERSEHGISFNEKWTYFRSDGSRLLVYWYRYDCRGVLRESTNGSTAVERL